MQDVLNKPSALADFPVVLHLPIQWSDLDAYGHVNNLVYLKWFEDARAAYATQVGVEVVPTGKGIGAVLSDIECTYSRQLKYPGHIYAGVSAREVTMSCVKLGFRIVCSATGVPVAEGGCTAVLYDHVADKPVAVPEEVLIAIEQLEGCSFRNRSSNSESP